jgi:1-acyl-sn-glycerol-3-phosphate acyltransferase
MLPAAILIIGLALLSATWAVFILPKWQKLQRYTDMLSTCGYLPLAPTTDAHRWLKKISRWVLKIQIGKFEVIGLENLNIPGHKIITPNHGHWVDPFIIAHLLPEAARYIAARGVFRFLHGLSSIPASRCGAFACDLTPGKGAPAKDCAIEVVTSGQTFVIFPEGWAYMNGVMGPLKKGAVRIGKESAHRLNKPVFYVPTYIRYGRYPGNWILKFPPPIQYLIVLLLFPLYRRGLTIVFGKPIRSDELRDDDAEATEQLRLAIVGLDPKHQNT